VETPRLNPNQSFHNGKGEHKFIGERVRRHLLFIIYSHQTKEIKPVTDKIIASLISNKAKMEQQKRYRKEQVLVRIGCAVNALF